MENSIGGNLHVWTAAHFLQDFVPHILKSLKTTHQISANHYFSFIQQSKILPGQVADDLCKNSNI